MYDPPNERGLLVFGPFHDDAPERLGVERSTYPSYTKKQGQYLAFIHYYTKIHGRPPAEHDLQRYFRTTPPTVHNMIKTLHGRGLIERTPGVARTIRVLLPRESLPDLE